MSPHSFCCSCPGSSIKFPDSGDQRFFLNDGDIKPVDGAPFEERKALLEQRQASIEARQRLIAAYSLLDNVSTAEFGVVPMAVHRRATIPWPPRPY
jgi:hypothetical protein